MKVKDNVLILAAGFGTRMGELGKILPKPLWPIDGTTLLAKQIQFARSITDGDIWVNVHHCKDLMCSYIQRFFPSVKIIIEDEILGSGGAVHNLLNVVGKKNDLITINSDVLYTLDQNDVKNFLAPIGHIRARLVSMPIFGNDGYNELVTDNGRLLAIQRPDKKGYKTYCGLGRINLSQIDYIGGSSAFFESVANYKSSSVEVCDYKSLQMRDYGTLDEYGAHFFYGSNFEVLIRSEIGCLKLIRVNKGYEASYISF